MSKITVFQFTCLFFTVFSAYSQGRGSIPEILLRPGWGEASRYPVDIVIGELGQGRAPYAAYLYADSVAAGLLSGQVSHPALVSVNPALRENLINSLGRIAPRTFRLGGGKQEPDGAVSFLVRFIGRDYGITGELYIKYSAANVNEDEPEAGSWVFDELLLEEAKRLDAAVQETMDRLDKLPYERFF